MLRPLPGDPLTSRRVATSTFSLVACDLGEREWGVALASKFLAIGALSVWAEPEVGAVATQSWIRAAYGRNGLRFLADGLSAGDALDRLVAQDEDRERRQVAFVDREGRAAAYTGPACLGWAGDRQAAGYSAQGNMLVSERTLDALCETFEGTAGRPLAERLLSALAAGQEAGGDRRGQQAAAIRVVRAGGGYGGADTVVDLRVDDHPTPVAELERLYAIHRLLFGSTPDEDWLTVDDALRNELRVRLDALGYANGDLAADFDTWAGVENLEERVRGVERIDPVVLDHLRGRERKESGAGAS